MLRNVAVTLWVILLSSVIVAAEDDAQEKQQTKLTAETLSGIKLREIGPALMSGRISDVAIDPVKPNTWYVAAGSGNLWKTLNAGTTWTPIFDNYSSYSIGCVTIDPSNRHIIWVGSGEAVGGRHVGYGDGVYKSLDGGKSFRNVGLKNSEHLAKILVDPRNSNVVYVASQGPLWSPGGERGLYKTTNGGTTWERILAKGPYTGVTDIAFDPRNPDVLFAVTHQRHRTVWSLINGGPESAIHKSVDGGKNWRELKQGLPAEDKGKIAIAVSPIQPDVVYATIELAGRTGGFWRSADCGETWNKMSDYITGGTGPHYYQEIFADPHRFDVVYQVNVRMGRTEDGGKTWETVESQWKHVDNHAVAFHPSDPDFLLVGCDGGLYRSYDYAKTFAYCANLPLTQFYKLSLDNDYPFYNIVGGTQDNNTQYGPSRTNNLSGIRNSDWRTTIGGDGHDCAIDPKDPNIIYCESQKGFLKRYDRRTGESIDIRPQPEKGEEDLRYNWDSPIHISPHSHTRLYFGSKKLHRSDDRGDSWTAISPDLSRDLDRFKLKVMDRVWSIDAVYDLYAMSHYGNITSISESPLQEGLIYVGTDDGLIQVTEDGGQNWRKIERVVDIPEFSFVNDVKADLHDSNTVYAVFSNHKTGDFKSYLMKSTDRGRSWKSIVGDLPDRHVIWRFVQDHVKKDLYFIGTEFGLFFTLDGGNKWIKLTGNVPTIPFRDIEIQQRENDLVGATFGRSFYVLDDYSPLRMLSEELLTDNEFVLFPVKKPLLYVPARALGGEKGSQGDAFYTAKNPAFGAVFTYYLRDTLKTRKQKRHESEAKTKNGGGDNGLPSFDDLTKEEREEQPVVTFTISDADGHVVNRIEGATSAGLHRIAWNLRYAPLGGTGGIGPLVSPGKYKVTAAKRVDDVVTPLGTPQTFEVVAIGKSSLPAQNGKDVLKFQMTVGELLRTVRGADGKVQEALDQLAQIKKAVKQTPNADASLFAEARTLEVKLMDVRVLLSGDTTRSNRSQTAKLSIIRRVQNALSGTLNNTYGPTKTHRRDYEIGREQYEDVAGDLKKLIETDFTKLKQKLDKAGVPWTPGRSLPTITPPGVSEAEAQRVTVRVAAVSFVPKKFDLQGNADRLERAFRRAKQGAAQIAVAPEGALDGYVVNEIIAGKEAAERMKEAAIPIDHAVIRRFQKLAIELEMCLAFGFAERIEGDVFNCAVFIDHKGRICGKYHKMQFAEGYDPSWWFNRLGRSSRAFDTPYGRCGLLICNDRWNPELARIPVLDGAQFLLIPSFGSRSKSQDEAVLSRGRENNVPVVEANVGVTLVVDQNEITSVDRLEEGITFGQITIRPSTGTHPEKRDQAERKFLKWREQEMRRRLQRTRKREQAVKTKPGGGH